MGKTEMMKKFEDETGNLSAIVKFMAGGQALERKSYPKLGHYDYNMEYLPWLEAKAEAYDRLMSGGKKTLKELANFLGMAVAVDKSGAIYAHQSVPHTSFGDMWVSNLFDCMAIHPNLIDYTGGWKASLTLPDGWEEKCHAKEDR